ncbi:Na+/H+ antiporter NhaC family protein [Thermohalobacter berrensis]|uniref:Sodium:proton antiporter n=1 Tax=Thermohalobacter berrensis TaxID=99594 RepID=A0A419SXX9_9FIRM|nr:Na+/H+ antiporter NhaC family protein [Thermohalobacter berrensis]RKD30045.1 sodium:proton antiporter [Thermohalobacter berrensis]
MDLILGLILIFSLLLYGSYKGTFLAYLLIAGLFILYLVGIKRGFKFKELVKFSINGSKKALLIVRIFMLIGAIISVWMASGTIPFIVYHGLEMINFNYFILSAFILSAIVSLLLGTAFGVVGTIGVVLMIMAKTGDINLSLVGGAIISGAYFGDRCSPMSSSAMLVATLTETKIYRNIKLMFKTTIIPLIITLIAFIILSLENPLIIKGNMISSEIINIFNIDIIVLIPVVVIIFLILLRIDIKISMFISILSGIIIAVFVQNRSILDVIKYIIFGFSLEEAAQLQAILKGGGVVSMLKASIIVLISTAYAGIFEGTNLLKELEGFIYKVSNKYGVFAAILFTSIITSSFGCTQTLAIILTYQLLKKIYDERGLNKYDLAIDIENTVVVMAALIPWNVAGAIPAATLSIDSSFIPYSFYLYFLPSITLLSNKLLFKLKKIKHIQLPKIRH